jgi:hypothetical protein
LSAGNPPFSKIGVFFVKGLLPEREFVKASFKIEGFNPKSIRSGKDFLLSNGNNSGLL